MKKVLPRLRSDREAELFVEQADLTAYDLTSMRGMRFEFPAENARAALARRPKRPKSDPSSGSG